MASPLEISGIRWWLRAGASAAEAQPRLERALALLEAGAPDLKSGRRKGLYRLDLAGTGAPDHLIKVNAYRTGRRRRSKARDELARAEAVATRGIATPVPLAAGERWRGGRLESCYLLAEIVPGACDLREYLAQPLAPAVRRRLAEAWGALARALHAAGVHQDDFQPNNFLVRGSEARPELLVIDFERVRIRTSVPKRLRRRALAKLDRELGGTPASLRLRFLRAYAGGDARAARDWFRAVAAEAPRLARRDAAHLRRNAARPGRRFRAVRLPGHTGLARPELDPARLTRALALAPPAGGAMVATPDTAEWCIALERPSPGHARRTFARALVLAARGLAPRPLALLRGRGRSLLVLERGERLLESGELGSDPTGEAARRVLERRLRGYGRLNRPLAAADVVFAPTGRARARAWLIGIEAFGLRRRFGDRGGSAERSR